MGARQPSRPGVATMALALLAVVVAIYARALDAPFVFDDVPAVVENDSITRLWPLVGDAQTRGPLNPRRDLPVGRRPLANLSLALDYAVHGLDPAGYRIVNVLLHVLAAVLLAAIVRRTLRLPYFGGAFAGSADALAFVVALVWAVHPLDTETIVSANLRTELLAGVFYLVVVWAALRWWAETRARWVVVATVAALACAGAKQTAVTLPITLLLFEWTFFGRTPWAAVRRSPWLYAGVTTSWLLLFGLNFWSVEGSFTDTRYDVPAWVWYVTQAKVVFVYLKLTVWPWPLAIHYAPDYLRTAGAALPWVAALAAIGVASGIALWRRRVVGLVAVLVPLLLAPSTLIVLVKMMASERRMYLPLAPLVALLVVGAYRLSTARGVRPRMLAAGAGVLVVVLATVSVVRLGAYESALSIWEDAARRQPTDAMSHYNVGNELVALGRDADAVPRFERAIELEPNHVWARENLAAALNRLGRPDEARAQLERALELEPDSAVAHNNLGSALIAMGRSDEALAHLRQALALEPNAPKAQVHRNLAAAFAQTGRADEGLTHLETAVRLDPKDAGARRELGAALMNAGRPGDAVEQFQAAVRLTPNDAQACNNLGVVLAALGRTTDAVAQLERAVRLAPGYVGARYNLAKALLDAGRPRDALAQLDAAVKLAPDGARDAAAMARTARDRARSRGDDATGAEIDAWLRRLPAG